MLWRRRSANSGRPLLLDQASSAELMRLGLDRFAANLHRTREAPSTLDVRRLLLPSPRIILPPLFLAFSIATSASLAAGTVNAVDDGSLNGSDLVRLALMAVVTLAVLRQAGSVFRASPAGRALSPLVHRLLPTRRTGDQTEPTSRRALLLDQVPEADLFAATPADFARVSALASAASSGRRVLHRAAWLAGIFIALGLAIAATAALGFNMARAFANGNAQTLTILVQVTFLLLAMTGSLALARVAWSAPREARLGSPLRFMPRLARQGFAYFAPAGRAVSSAVSGAVATVAGGGALAAPVTVAAMTVATVTVTSIGFGASLPVVNDFVESLSPNIGEARSGDAAEQNGGSGGTSGREGTGSGGGSGDEEEGGPNDPKATPGTKASATPVMKATATPNGGVKPTEAAGTKPTPTPTPGAKPTATPVGGAKPTATATAGAKPTATSDLKPTSTPTSLPKPTATPTSLPKPTATPTGKP